MHYLEFSMARFKDSLQHNTIWLTFLNLFLVKYMWHIYVAPLYTMFSILRTLFVCWNKEILGPFTPMVSPAWWLFLDIKIPKMLLIFWRRNKRHQAPSFKTLPTRACWAQLASLNGVEWRRVRVLHFSQKKWHLPYIYFLARG